MESFSNKLGSPATDASHLDDLSVQKLTINSGFNQDEAWNQDSRVRHSKISAIPAASTFQEFVSSARNDDFPTLATFISVLSTHGVEGPLHLKARNLRTSAIQVGRGSQFAVFRWDDQGSLMSSFKDKVIKRVRITADELKSERILALNTSYRSHLNTILLEVVSLCHPYLRSHRNIVSLIEWGYDYEDPLTAVPILVIEAAFMPLDRFLQTHLISSIETEDIRQHMALDVAAGLEALHSLNIIQGDVKPENILVFKTPDNPEVSYVAKLSDFGLCIDMAKKDNLHPSMYAGTLAWIGPEAGEDDYGVPRYNPESHGPFSAELLKGFDGFSYGMVLLALFYTDGKPPKSSELWPQGGEDSADAFQFMIEQSPRSTKLPVDILRGVVQRLLAERVDSRPAISPELLSNESKAYCDWNVARLSLQSGGDGVGRRDTTLNRGVTYWSRIDKALMTTLDAQHQLSKGTDKALAFDPDVLFGLFISHANDYGKDFRSNALEYLQSATDSGHSVARALYARVMSANDRTLNKTPGELRKWQLDAVKEGFLFPDGDIEFDLIETARAKFRSNGGYCTDPFLSEATIVARARDAAKLETWISQMGSAAQTNRIDTLGNTMIHVAAALGEIKALRLLLNLNGAPAGLRNDEGETPVYKACQGGHGDCVRLLLERGHSADISTSATNMSCLHWLFNFPKNEITAIGTLLVRKGLADVNVKINPRRTSSGYPLPVICKHYPFSFPYGTPIHFAAFARNWVAMDTLLELGADVNALYASGESASSPLAMAVHQNDVHVVKYLLSHGADVHIEDQKGRNLLHLLSFRTDPIFGSLRRRFHDWVFHMSFATQLEACTQIAHTLVQAGVSLTAEARAYASPTPMAMCLAREYQEGPIICGLLAAGADANAANKSTKETLLHSWTARDARMQTFPGGYHYVLAKIIESTSVLNAQCEWDGDFPLHIVASSAGTNLQFERSVELLLGKATPVLDAIFTTEEQTTAMPFREWSDINAINKNGFTPLMLALGSSVNDDCDPAFRGQVLIEHGASSDITTSVGQSALSEICNNRQLMDIETRDLLKIILSKMDSANRDKIIAGYPDILGRVAADGKLETTKFLLENGLSTHVNAVVKPRDFRKTKVQGNALTLTFANAEIGRRRFIREAALYIKSTKTRKADRKKSSMQFRGTAGLSDMIFGGHWGSSDGSTERQVSRERSKEAYLAYPEVMRVLLAHGSTHPCIRSDGGELWKEGMPTWWDATDMSQLGFTGDTQPYRDHWQILYELECLEPNWKEDALVNVRGIWEGIITPVRLLLRWPQLQIADEVTEATLTDGSKVSVRFDSNFGIKELRDMEDRRLNLAFDEL